MYLCDSITTNWTPFPLHRAIVEDEYLAAMSSGRGGAGDVWKMVVTYGND